MSEPIISVSGLRGIVGQSLTSDVVASYAEAFAEGLAPGDVVVTRDGRANGRELIGPVIDGLARSGRVARVIDGGIAATPTTGVLVRHHGSTGGIQITASHNPAEYNGLKLFSAQGRVLPAEAGKNVLDAYQRIRSRPGPAGVSTKRIDTVTLDDTLNAHWELVRQLVDVDQIRRCAFRVVLDANHGSGSVLGRHLLDELGCEVTMLGGDPDGSFDHPPEPTAENLASVLTRVQQAGADVGFCQDPDADRLALVDETGRYVGEEYTLAICADHVLRERPGPLVTNCSSSRMTQDLAARYQVPYYQSAVGEANVVDKMLEVDAVLGGEGNGGVIDPRVGLVRDSFVGIVMTLAAMASRGMAVSGLVDELPRYAIHKSKIQLSPDRVATGLDALAKHFADARQDRLDGLRLDWPDRWLLVRPSNTEPIVRAIAEAPATEEAKALCDEAARVLSSAG